MRMQTLGPEVSVVVPVYFNAGSLAILYERIAAAVLQSGAPSWDITFVDDGSRDESRAVLRQLQEKFDNVRVLELSRNFGSMAAITAGLAQAKGPCVAVISADLQDPPELLTTMINDWRAGTKVVLAARESRQDPLLSRLFSGLFYWLFRRLVNKEMPPGGFDFFVIDQQVAGLLTQYGEKNSSIPAALLWLGFSRKIHFYTRAERIHGTSMWTFTKKFKYMYDSILSFSYVPLRFMSMLGALGVLLALGYGLFVIGYRLNHPEEPSGWASLMVVTLFFSSLVLASLGIVGEYVWRTFDAARPRPLFIVETSREPRAQTPPQTSPQTPQEPA
jgi:dolichol-phosphate mannosyltransferase